MRLRHVVLPAMALTAAIALATAFGSQATVETASLAPQNVVVPQDVQIADATPATAPAPTVNEAEGEAAARNLKAALDAIPQKPDFAYHAPVDADAASALSQKLASLQNGLSDLLQDNGGVSSRTVSVGKGDTLMDLLLRNHVPATQAHDAIAALSKVYDPRALNPKHEITVFFHRDPALADPQFKGLSIEKDVLNTVSVNLAADGSYKTGQTVKDTQRQVMAYHGTINGSFYGAAAAAGVPDAVILEMIKLYSASVDFQREIQQGDGFDVMYEQYTTDAGDVVPGRGNIIFARMNLDGRSLPMYRYEGRDGDVAYYDAQGRSSKRSLMRTPIDGARISSGFGMRNHPVLGFTKMHKGIDFAAPRGTPIYAAGDGVIEKMSPFSTFGNYVRLKHGNGLETAYAHMKGFKPGLHAGMRVKQGEVIGYVGTTGRSTGPHLHYEVLVKGKQVNPGSLNLPQSNTLAGRDLKAFKAQVASIERDFAKYGNSRVPVATNANGHVQTASRQ